MKRRPRAKSSIKVKPEKWDGQRETLDDLNEAVNYNRWIYQSVMPYLGKRILEVGCGTGNITGFLSQGRQVMAADIHEGYLVEAKKRWGGKKNVRFRKFDLEKGLHAFKSFRPDTIISVNVLEHIEKDELFLRESFRLLPEGGRLLIFVPAFQWLYGTMDASYGHHRRYTKRSLRQRMEKAGFQIGFSRYLNLLGVLGWFVNGRVLRCEIIPKGQMLLYDRILKWVVPVEKFLPKPIGLSLVSVGHKTARSK